MWMIAAAVGVGCTALALSLLGSEPAEQADAGLAVADDAVADDASGSALPSTERSVLAYMGSTDPGRLADEATSPDLVAALADPEGLGSGDSTPIVEETGGDTYDDGETQELADEELAALEGTPSPDERLPLDYEALGYEDEAAMHRDVRERLGIPSDQALALYGEIVDGEEVVTLAVGTVAEDE